MADPYAPSCAECEEPIWDAADAVVVGETTPTQQDAHGDVTYVHTYCRG